MNVEFPIDDRFPVIYFSNLTTDDIDDAFKTKHRPYAVIKHGDSELVVLPIKYDMTDELYTKVKNSSTFSKIFSPRMVHKSSYEMIEDYNPVIIYRLSPVDNNRFTRSLQLTVENSDIPIETIVNNMFILSRLSHEWLNEK